MRACMAIVGGADFMRPRAGATPAASGHDLSARLGRHEVRSWTAERRRTPPVVTAAQANWMFGFLGAYNYYMHTGPSSGIDEKLDQDAILGLA